MSSNILSLYKSFSSATRISYKFFTNLSIVKLEILRDHSTIFRTATGLFHKNTILKNFVIFTGKHLCLSFFFNAMWVCNFIKKRLQHQYFLVNIAKLARTFILKNIYKQILLHLRKVFSKNFFSSNFLHHFFTVFRS